MVKCFTSLHHEGKKRRIKHFRTSAPNRIFYNIPVSQFSNGNGSFYPTPAIAKMLIDRLDSVVAQIKPDVLVLDRDPLSVAKESAHSAYLRQLIVNIF